jgi:hypothetical protein
MGELLTALFGLFERRVLQQGLHQKKCRCKDRAAVRTSRQSLCDSEGLSNKGKMKLPIHFEYCISN